MTEQPDSEPKPVGSDADARAGPAHPLARLAGAVGTALALGGVFLAVALSPTFSWAASALSDLGVDPRTALAFNGGLLLGGGLALGYVPALREDSRAVAATYGLCAAAMAGVGAFPSDDPLHYPAAVAFFVLLAATLALDGARRRGTTTGRVSLLLATASVAAWPLWFAAGLGPGIAVPELVGALSLAAWVLALAPPAPLRSRF
ncbi:DUF998 domain-containing protein [Halogeometricum sp. S1BR25-6]|uniref:DUF998 domain-containing protein n=1 Tax=Halogeometricum salsisoli TaxID=2950536 RepID=A0ABU2GDR3_9EURY|nr:DUF998 domain-containing protein [Halogeometricum sp. S1BR25-6]MDS0298459.1 DUF998 domain-containing protein [Halogeometricum sp. S1BR25-6]